MKKNLLILLIIIILLGGGFFYLYSNPQLPLSQKILSIVGFETNTGEIAQIANPASVFCEQNSGMLEIVTDLSGGQSGLCHLSDGNVCDEWAYFRGECPVIITEATGTIESSGTINETNNTSFQYLVKTEMGNDIPGENINVFDKDGSKIFSLLASNAPDLQHFDKIVGRNLIVDYGTSFDRALAIFDVITQEKIFESTYHEDGSGFGINNDSVTFNYTIGETPNLPKCSSDYNGHTEVRIFNLNTKKLKKTGEIKCAFFE